MAPFSSFSFLVVLFASIGCATACYTAIFGFGDSLTDAGNLIHLETDGSVPHMYFPPYGETFFGHPTGRCSDGRVILDIIAEHYGLAIPPPSLSRKAQTGGNNIRQGVNFAVVGSRALPAEFYEKLEIYDTVTNVSMRDQLHAFKDMIPSLCNSPSDCKNMLENSLFVLGEFGGNDYTHSLLSGKDITVIRPFIPIVAHAIAEGAHKLIELGARTVMVPSVLPLGCAASYLTYYPSPNPEDYDDLGCLIWVNDMASYHNQLLQKELNLVRERHPYANIIYTDIFNAAMQIYDGPDTLGFSGGALRACCGGGGEYNFNPDLQCGDEGATSCPDPSTYVNWDGYHLTEAAYKLITKSLLDGTYTYPTQYYGLEIPPPSLSRKAQAGGNNIRQGVNFAVVGSRALPAEFYEKLEIYDTVTNVSMGDQLHAFKDMIPSLCNSPSDCKNLLENSLFVLGEFGGNDYTHSLLSGKDISVIRPFIPIVAHAIAEGAQKLIELGARTIMVPSVLPLGCAASYLTYYPSPNIEDYDDLGCLIWVNDMAAYHNQLLQKELSLLRERHPYANIIYTDIFNASMKIYDGPETLGFSGGALTACCGGGGPYNFNPNLQCGDVGASNCPDPSTFVNWDGYHLTETAYILITNSLLDGTYTYPRMDTLCPANAKVAQV
nr:GDSL esterase/lipase At1g28580-like [Ipomoea batatas]